MRIVWLECKKALLSPVFIGLLILFSTYNIFLIVSSSAYKEELTAVNELIDTYGRGITANSLAEFKKDVQEHDELQQMYFNAADSIDENYAAVDIQASGEGEIAKYGLSGSAAAILGKEYDKLELRFDEMIENNEHKQWFFAGKAYFMHSFLFKTVFTHIVIESLLLIVLTTALITSYEFEQKTQLLAFSSARGRKLMKDKLAASAAVAVFIMSTLLIVTLGAYFIVFDYSHVWATSISNALNWEYNFPYIAWHEMSTGAFLWAVIGLVLAGGLLMSLLTFSLSVIVKNSYIAFAGMALFFIAGILLPSFMAKSSVLLFMTAYNLSQLLLGLSTSFMGGGLTGFQNYEWLTVTCWTLIAAGLCILSIKRFTKLDIE